MAFAFEEHELISTLSKYLIMEMKAEMPDKNIIKYTVISSLFFGYALEYNF